MSSRAKSRASLLSFFAQHSPKRLLTSKRLEEVRRPPVYPSAAHSFWQLCVTGAAIASILQPTGKGNPTRRMILVTQKKIATTRIWRPLSLCSPNRSGSSLFFGQLLTCVLFAPRTTLRLLLEVQSGPSCGSVKPRSTKRRKSCGLRSRQMR
jgi:hypothetical protein